eukprot:gene544-biopygen12875
MFRCRYIFQHSKRVRTGTRASGGASAGVQALRAVWANGAADGWTGRRVGRASPYAHTGRRDSGWDSAHEGRPVNPPPAAGAAASVVGAGARSPRPPFVSRGAPRQTHDAAGAFTGVGGVPHDGGRRTPAPTGRWEEQLGPRLAGVGERWVVRALGRPDGQFPPASDTHSRLLPPSLDAPQCPAADRSAGCLSSIRCPRLYVARGRPQLSRSIVAAHRRAARGARVRGAGRLGSASVGRAAQQHLRLEVSSGAACIQQRLPRAASACGFTALPALYQRAVGTATGVPSAGRRAEQRDCARCTDWRSLRCSALHALMLFSRAPPQPTNDKEEEKEKGAPPPMAAAPFRGRLGLCFPCTPSPGMASLRLPPLNKPASPNRKGGAASGDGRLPPSPSPQTAAALERGGAPTLGEALSWSRRRGVVYRTRKATSGRAGTRQVWEWRDSQSGYLTPVSIAMKIYRDTPTMALSHPPVVGASLAAITAPDFPASEPLHAVRQPPAQIPSNS